MSSKPLSFPIPFDVQAPTCPVITDKSVLDEIGNTPLIRIHNIGKEYKNIDIYAKAEWKNAGGSVKSRPALKMIEDAENDGRLNPGGTIIEGTSGNTGM